MRYSQITDGQVTQTVMDRDSLPSDWVHPDPERLLSVSGPLSALDDDALAELGWCPVVEDKEPDIDPEKERVMEVGYEVVDGVPYLRREVEKIPPPSDEEIAARKAADARGAAREKAMDILRSTNPEKLGSIQEAAPLLSAIRTLLGGADPV